MNTALLEKWVDRFTSSREDLVAKVLKEIYGRELTWKRYTAPFQVASSFWKGLRHFFVDAGFLRSSPRGRFGISILD